jgi:serine/threonine protein phosphatase 1
VKTFVIGDIHGAFKALLQCLERSDFNKIHDRLIVIGDVCDGYPQTQECIDQLLKIKHCDLILGNHDMWMLDWALTGERPEIWTSQGGDRTIESYSGGPIPKAHVDFLKSGRLWLEIDDQLFVHGGFNLNIPLSSHSAEDLVWDRRLLENAWEKHSAANECKMGSYRDIFIGHTPTERYNTFKPIHACNVWDIDTGAGWSGRLTIMNVNTKEYWQSDLTPDLYGVASGRK